ncbi:MAG TPA: serine/threonine-protein kinase, partial [Polyangiales bacterium]
MSVESKRPRRPSLEAPLADQRPERGSESISGRYQVEGALGEGGMALVQRVRDTATGTKLALKRLTAKSPKLLALFEREYHTLASLRHPSIVKAFDYGSDAHGPYYTMELLEGSDVSSLAPLPWQEVCQLVRDVAQGVALLHARRLLHRDLSARNVWRTPDGQVKLIDFGTMAAFGMAHDLVGTAPYVAPEALRGMEIDQRTDLYALGALTYYMLTGRHAFPARSLGQLETVWQERPRAPSKRVAELGREDLPPVPAALDALVESLLSQDTLARPTTAADLIDRLSVIAGLPADKPLRVLESYLSAPAFVGRRHERERLRRALDTSLSGSATHVLIEAGAGMGRSRLLAEIGLSARLAGATVLATEARVGMGTNEVAQELSLRLLAALPAHARTLAEPYAATLGHVSSTLRERLGIRVEQLAEMPTTHGEARMRVQAALRDWFLDVARTHPLVILADDADGFDDGSAAWLAALSREAKAHKLLIVAAVRTERALSL